MPTGAVAATQSVTVLISAAVAVPAVVGGIGCAVLLMRTATIWATVIIGLLRAGSRKSANVIKDIGAPFIVGDEWQP